ARCKGSYGHHAEDNEVIERLHARFFFGAMTFEHQGGGPDKTEIPAQAKQDQSKPEMGYVYARQAHGNRGGGQDQSTHHHPPRTKTRDEPTGKEAGPIHRDHM